MEVDEKRCISCGRIGTRAFVHALAEDRVRRWPYGPWECEWKGACQRRREAKTAAAQAEEQSRVTADEIVPVDLDAIQATTNPD